MEKKNLLLHGDNIVGLKFLINECALKGKIDLIYIDPPFSTNTNFTITNGRAATISNSKNGKIAYTDKIIGGDFLDFLKERLILLKELLSNEGSIYLHIDYKVGHYVKVLMDEVFGFDNFKNDITRIKCNPKNFHRTSFGNIKDMILFYSKSKNNIWNVQYEPYTEKDLETLFPQKKKNGRRYTSVPIHAPGETNNSELFRGLNPPAGRHWRTDVKIMEQWDKDGLIEWSSKGNPRKILYSDEREGKRYQDIWNFKDPQYVDYPTEKNSELLDLIIKSSSNKGSYVLDCFCGSGTTLKSAHLNKRKWIGIDSSELSLKTTMTKLGSIKSDFFVDNVDYEIIQLPDNC